MIAFGLRRATNIHLQGLAVAKQTRAGSSTTNPPFCGSPAFPARANRPSPISSNPGFHAHGVHTIMLDGDNVRHGLNKDLGFTEADRVENIRRIGEVAKLMTEAGLIVLCSFISPFRAERRMVRELRRRTNSSRFSSIRHLRSASRAIPKGLYKQAMAGEIKNFTGIDRPTSPRKRRCRSQVGARQPEILANRVIGELEARGFVTRF